MDFLMQVAADATRTWWRLLYIPLLAALWALPPGASTAATLHVVPSYVQSFDAAMTPLGSLSENGAATPLGGFVHVEFRILLEDAQPGEDFWLAMFHVQFGPGLANSSGWLDPAAAQGNGLYGAAPSMGMFDSNGPAAGGVQSHWQFGNGDFGVDPNDLQTIIVEAAPAEAANRQYGEAVRPGAGFQDALGSPTLVGAVLLTRTSDVDSWVSVVPVPGSPWGLYTGNSDGLGDFAEQPGATILGGTATLFVPEPASLALLVSGVVGWLAFRARFQHRHSG